MNSDSSIPTTDKAVRFKFRDLRRSVAMQCLFFFMFVFFFVFALRQDNSYWPYAFFLPVFSLLLFVWYSTVVVAMDIVVDTTGISRCVGRRVIKHIPWRDVRLIWVFDSYSWQEHKKTLGIHILPRNKEHPSSVLGGKVAIVESPMRQGKFSELIEAMNTYIAEHHINIESTVGGKTSHPDSLVFVPRRPD
ncbi:hypothetical protein [Dyella sp. C9]|uniref:hypothetical protein n=1 Tax=Dyella sp. C9 TaxID=2202154 RepID=UPI0013002501|nr:hypothetical protein [Dyella sp. C9]